MALDRTNGQFVWDNRQQVGRAGISVRMYVDENGSDTYDEGEQIIPGNALRLHRASGRQVSKEGISRLTQLQPYRTYNFIINEAYVRNPTLVPRYREFSMVTDPNRYRQLDVPFIVTGIIDGTVYRVLYADAPEGGAPLTMLAFRRGLAPIGDFGHYIVLLSVLLFGLSTAIAWSYYGDRCAEYLFGPHAILPYRIVYCGMHLMGALIAPAVAWDLGDIFLGIVILPNLLALVLLSGKTRDMMDSYFGRQPWLQNLEDHKKWKEEHKKH